MDERAGGGRPRRAHGDNRRIVRVENVWDMKNKKEKGRQQRLVTDKKIERGRANSLTRNDAKKNDRVMTK